VDQCPGNLDHRDAIDQREGLAAIALVALNKVIAEERGAGGQGGPFDVRGGQVETGKTDPAR
jgi:hypothetical protein